MTTLLTRLIAAALPALAVAVVLGAGLTGRANAAQVIDDFDTGASQFTNGGLFEGATAQAGSMAGGARFTGLLCFFGCYNGPAGLTVGAGNLSVTTPSDGLTTTRVLWGDVNPFSTTFPFAPMSLNLSGDSGFELSFSSISAPLLVQMVISTRSADLLSSRTSTYTQAVPLPGPGLVLGAGATTVSLPFARFVGTANLADIDGIGLVLGGNNGFGVEHATASFALDRVSTVSAVPDASSSATLLLGLGLLGMVHRRRRPSTRR